MSLLRSRFATLAIALLGTLPFAPTLRAAFVYDDTTIIRDNALLRGWGALARVWTSPYWPSDGPDVLGLYRPLHVALLASVWNAGHGSALSFHLYALALGALSAASLWWLLRRGAGGLAAFVAAAWFATHPLHVEAIASVANTSELLVLLCTAMMVRVIRAEPPGLETARGNIVQPLLLASLAAAALLAKESGLLALPVAVVTAWGWRASRRGAPEAAAMLRLNGRGLAAATGAIGVVLIARASTLGTLVAPPTIAAQGLDGVTAASRVAAMASLWPRLAGMLGWPRALAPYYGPTIFPAHRAALAAVSVGIALALLGLAIVLARRGDRRPLVALGWMALTYLPASNLLTPTGQIISDRTLFGASAGVALAIAWSLDRMPRTGRLAAIGLLSLAIARDAIVTTRYAVAWTSHRTLWTRVIEAEPEEHLGYKLLGMDARARGDGARAVELLGRALAMAPSDRQARFELAQALYSSGRFAPAAATFAPLMRDADARSEPNLVALYLDAIGRAEGARAVADAAKSLVHPPSAAVASLYLGLAHERLGEPALADSAYAAGILFSPRDTVLAGRLAALRARTRH